MASIPTFQSNPYSSFDPSQWQNPYSQFQSSALPWPPTYAGTPTDAMGNPIASYQAPQAPQAQAAAPTPGMTLNSSPAQLPLMPSGGTNQVRGGSSNPALTASDLSNYQAQQGMLAGAPTRQALAGIPNAGQMNAQQLGAALAAQQQPGAAAGAAGAAAGGAPANNWQAAIRALANPGNPVTPGATVPQSAQSYQPSNGVLQQFLANWRPAASGPGSGFQQTFANALQGGGTSTPSSGGGGGFANLMPFTNYGDMHGASGLPPMPAGAVAPAKDFATQGYLDANGTPTAGLNALRQSWTQAQQQLAQQRGR